MGSIGRFKKVLRACMDTSSINGHWTDSEGRCPLNSCYNICGCQQRGCKKGSRACSKQPLFLLLSEAEYQAGCTIHLNWWVLLLFYLRRAWCRLFVDSLWLSGQSLKTQANQTCLEKQNLFLKKRLLLCPVCHWLWWELGGSECIKQKVLKRIQRLFCPHSSCQKIPLSLTQRATSPHSGGHKHFKVQLCEKVQCLDANTFPWPPCSPFGLLHTFLDTGVSDWPSVDGHDQ